MGSFWTLKFRALSLEKFFVLPIDKIGETCYTYTNLYDRWNKKKGEHSHEKVQYHHYYDDGDANADLLYVHDSCTKVSDVFSLSEVSSYAA
mgnify:CR=1 FL=1